MSAGTIGRFSLSAPIDAARHKRIDWWRGAVAARFPNIADFHGHADDGTLYRYAPVQYREVDDCPAVFAMNGAMDALVEHEWVGTAVDLGGHARTIVDVQWQPVDLAVREAPDLRRYAFRAPWLALNQANHDRFRGMTDGERRTELDRILTGNLLSLCKGLGVRVDTRILASAAPTGTVGCQFKDVVLQGFWGGFVVNLDLGDGLAIGKAVSRGHGWFVRDGG